MKELDGVVGVGSRSDSSDGGRVGSPFIGDVGL